MSPAGRANQVDADTFDCDLHRLLERAIRYGSNPIRPGSQKWREVAGKIASVRPIVRAMMHPGRREETAA